MDQTVEAAVEHDPLSRENSGLAELVLADDDERGADGRFIAVSLRKQNMTLADVANLDEASSLQRLTVASARLTDAEMELLTEFTGLEKLELGINTRSQIQTHRLTQPRAHKKLLNLKNVARLD